MKLDTKYYDFHVTTHTTDGPVVPPPGEGWFFVDVTSTQNHYRIVWAKEKKR